jgi:hypothetical protein
VAGSHEPLVVSTRRYFCMVVVVSQPGMLPTFAFASRRVGEMLPSSHSRAVDFTNNCTATSPMCRVPEGRSGLSLTLLLQQGAGPNAVCT